MIAATLPTLVVVVPLVVALLIPMLTRLWKGNGWALVVAALTFSTWGTIELLRQVVVSGAPITYEMGAWTSPSGIPYVVDHLNGMVLVMVAAMGLLAAVWMWRGVTCEVRPRARRSFYTVFLLFTAGLLGITITGDVFNL